MLRRAAGQIGTNVVEGKQIQFTLNMEPASCPETLVRIYLDTGHRTPEYFYLFSSCLIVWLFYNTISATEGIYVLQSGKGIGRFGRSVPTVSWRY
jgi:hypothetical protein